LGGTRRDGYKYSDRAGVSDGITKVKVIDGAATKTKAFATGKGANLPLVSLPLGAGQLPVTVQLVTNDAAPHCWTADYANPPAKNEAKKFKVKLP